MKRRRHIEAFYELSELMNLLDVELRYMGVQEHEVRDEAIWFAIDLPHGGRALISFAQQELSLSHSKVTEMKRFLSQFAKSGIETIRLKDFGVWIPPSTKPVYEVTSQQGELHFLVCFERYSAVVQTNAATRLFHLFATQASADFWMELDLPESLNLLTMHSRSPYIFPSFQTGRIRGDRGSDLLGKLNIDNGRTFMSIEKESNNGFGEQELAGRITVRGIRLSFADYLALQPGDEIGLEEITSLPATFDIGGVTVAYGRVEVEEGKILFLCEHPSSPSVGNKREESSIKDMKAPMRDEVGAV